MSILEDSLNYVFDDDEPNPEMEQRAQESLREWYDAVADREREGLAPEPPRPPTPNMNYLWPHRRRYGALYGGHPKPPGAPTFIEYLEDQGVPLPPQWRRSTSRPAAGPGDPVQPSLPGPQRAE